MRRPAPTLLTAALVTVVLVAVGCSGDPRRGVATGADAVRESRDAEQQDLEAALSTPVEDSVYPEQGDPSVDALHYDLDLTWDPATDTLTGDEAIVFRATGDGGIRLDLDAPLEVTGLSIDGEQSSWTREGGDLVVTADLVQDERYLLRVGYTGTPEPVDAPTTRNDLTTLGFTIDDEHQAWTMQEPFGASTWYAVNDQPSDKALYDVTLHTPSPWVGVANGEQVSDDDDGTTRTTSYHLAEPAASYLVTVAFGDYRRTDVTGPHGLPITYWTPRGRPVPAGVRYAPEAIAWLERRLGPYPFDTAGIVLVDSDSGMETQTMVTLGENPYSTSRAVVLHELAHQWYGDQVTPADWRDVWMNEGMAMYLQLLWEAERDGFRFSDYLGTYEREELTTRAEDGPPGAYDPEHFGSGNIYYGGAFLWHEIRKRVGDRAFFRVVRSWPRSQDNRSTDRATLLAYLEQQTGTQLDDLWDAWLLDTTTPPRS